MRRSKRELLPPWIASLDGVNFIDVVEELFDQMPL